MSQISMIYNSQQWNEHVQKMRGKNTSSIQEVMLPMNNIAQKNKIYITNTDTTRLTTINLDNIPQNIQFNFKNKGFFNNFNSNLSFNIPIHITNLPQYNTNTKCFKFDYSDSQFQQFDYNNVKVFASTSKALQYNIVLYNNYICLQVHVSGTQTGDAPFETHIDERDLLIRLYKIPPSPAAYLDNVMLQKNNKSDNAFNSYYQDIFRKQAINNQLIEQNFSDFMKNQYAYVNHNQDVSISVDMVDDQTSPLLLGNQPIPNDKIQVLASYISTPTAPILDIVYNYQVSIPIVYFHPFFQLAYNTPMELLNDELTMIFNFNAPIFTACYAYTKAYYKNLVPTYFNNMISVSFEGINDMKIILYKDAVMNYKTIEKSKDGVFYLTYRNSDKAQYQAFNKYDSIVLQNLLPRLNSLDMIQMSLFDKKQYALYQSNPAEIPDMDYYLGYSSMFNDQDYVYCKGQTDGESSTVGNIRLEQPLQLPLNTNGHIILTQSDNDISYVSFGDVQISIDDSNIIPYTYQTLEDIYKTNMSLYDIQDNKFTPNNHWQYPYYLKYYNTYIYKFDQKFGDKSKLQQADFQGLTVSNAKSNIITRLYNYNNNNNPPHQITADEFTDGFYNNVGSTHWIDNPVFCEFLYYYSSLFVISGGDLMMVSEQSTANVLKNTPRFNYVDLRLKENLPVIAKITENEVEQKLMDKINELQRQMKQPETVQLMSQGPQTVMVPQGQSAETKIEPEKKEERYEGQTMVENAGITRMDQKLDEELAKQQGGSFRQGLQK